MNNCCPFYQNRSLGESKQGARDESATSQFTQCVAENRTLWHKSVCGPFGNLKSPAPKAANVHYSALQMIVAIKHFGCGYATLYFKPPGTCSVVWNADGLSWGYDAKQKRSLRKCGAEGHRPVRPVAIHGPLLFAAATGWVVSLFQADGAAHGGAD